MLHRVEIDYPATEIARNRKRLEGTCHFHPVDRVPVSLGIEARYLLHARGITFAEYFSDPVTQLIQQLENIKWRIENIPDDWWTSPSITVSPDFQNVTNASGCGCEIFWQENETPHATPCIHSKEEFRRHTLPDRRQTLWGKKLVWYRAMKEAAEKIEVRLNGGRIPIHVSLSINGDSPFMSAVEMAGADFYRWLLEEPSLCHEVLQRITDRYIEVESEFRRVSGRPIRDGLNYSDDSAQVISLKQYREFCVPVGRRLYEHFGCDRPDGRLMHLCGRNVHLHPSLLEDLSITLLHGFGSANKPEEMHVLAGKVVLHGNIDPMTLYQGTPAEIEAEVSHLLEILAPFGGLILGDGFNVVPGTPIGSLEVVRKVSAEYGVLPHTESKVTFQ